ncbi:hypothetical protein GQ42DRAFT_162859 [Ramicandelaber brevisporus]|nr:hypothetical protein GQ42DRAFT_162859 [Ramicandelaber brevisporus]
MMSAADPVVNTAAASTAATATATKKTKKAPSVDQWQDRFAAQPTCVAASSLSKGRRAAATSDLAPGTLVFVESATAKVVHNDNLSKVCAQCTMLLTEEAFLPSAEDPNTRVARHCLSCQYFVYCSEECQTKHAEAHAHECSLFTKLPEIVNKLNEAGVGLDSPTLNFLKLVLSVLGAIANGSASTELSESVPTPVSVIDSLPDRQDSFLNDLLEQLTKIADALIKVTEPKNSKGDAYTQKELLALVRRIHSSRFILSDAMNALAERPIIHGLYPLASLFFSHSCAPNCTYHLDNKGRLTIRTLTRVEKDESLTVSFVNLYQPREERRQMLLHLRQLWCACRRCRSDLVKSSDRFLDGVVCKSCKEGLVIYGETQDVDDVNEFLNQIPDLSQALEGKVAVCSNCQAPMPVPTLVKVLSEAITEFRSADKYFAEGNFAVARLELENFLSKYEGGKILHPYNSFIYRAQRNLITSLRQLGEHSAALERAKTILNRLRESNIVADNSFEIIEMTSTVGDSAANVVSNLRSRAPQPQQTAEGEKPAPPARDGSAIREKIRQDLLAKNIKVSINAYTDLVASTVTVLGPDHPRTKLIISQVKPYLESVGATLTLPSSAAAIEASTSA